MIEKEQTTRTQAQIVYLQLITALMCEPEEEVLHSRHFFENLTAAVTILNPDLMGEVHELQKASRGQIQPLMVEYARLFIGPFKLVAPPYASCYLGSKTLNNEITDWVRGFYEDSGLEFDYTIMDLPDHVAVETEFLQYALTRSIVALKEGHAEEASLFMSRYSAFLNQHHKRWVPLLSKQVADNTTHPFYHSLFNFARLKLLVL